jgi:tetratricopeptide (TPR) repeat protein
MDVVTAYDRATLYDPEPAREMFAAAERAIVVPTDLQSEWDAWLRTVKTVPYDPQPVPETALEALQLDPLNGDRLSNLAISFYFQGLTTHGGSHDTALVRNTLTVLAAASSAFPESRAATLNYVFLAGFYTPEGPTDPAQGGNARTLLDHWLETTPLDLTALRLSRQRYGALPDSTLDRFTALTESVDPAQAALGHAWLGDAMLQQARSEGDTAPFTAQHMARAAIEHYDAALVLSDDTSIYHARAVALEFLGDIPAAIETQQRAIDLEPDAVPLYNLLAELLIQRRGDEPAVHRAVADARDVQRTGLSLAELHPDPFLRDVEFKPFAMAITGDRRGAEYAIDRPSRTYLRLYQVGFAGGGAGGYIISLDLIPLYEEEPEVASRVTSPADRAAYNAMIASVILGDPVGVAEDLARMERLWATRRQAAPTGPNSSFLEVIPAAQLVSDPHGGSWSGIGPLDFAITALRYAGLPGQAASLCRSALEFPEAVNARSYLLACIAENAYLNGQLDVAHQAFGLLEEHADWGGSTPMRAAMVAEVVGDTEGAMRLHTIVAEESSSQGERGIALARLGDMKLDAGDASGAIEVYDRAIEEFTATPDGMYEAQHESRELQYIRNNRGVAWMMLVGNPGCSGYASVACANALADFDAVLRSDAHNPIALMGKGWIERLRGEHNAASRSLDLAVQSDPTLGPAHNDLGVIAAQRGDRDVARQAFLAALAGNPDYDLALWNLGVLEMQQGIGGIPQGQAYFARAILQTPSFATSAPAFRFDDRVYRIEFTEESRPGTGWSFGKASSVALSGLGVITMLGVALKTFAHVAMDKAQTSASMRAEAAKRGAMNMIGDRLNWSLPARWSRWLPLLITLPVLALTTAWPAARESPGVGASVMVLALFAAAIAVITHEIGHVLIARWRKAELQPAQWGMGVAVAMALMPLGVSNGPFPGQRVLSEDEGKAWGVYLGGPLGNLLVAVASYILFYFQPLPGLRLIALTQITALGYALLPFEPLDGAALSRKRPMVVSGLAFLVLVVGILVFVGKL